MKTIEYLIKLIHIRLTQNIKHNYPDKLDNFEVWLSNIHPEEEDDFELEEYEEYLTSHKMDVKICLHPYANFLMAEDGSREQFELINKLHKERPDDLLTSAFWIWNKVEEYRFGERLNYDVTNFLQETFTNKRYEVLIRLKDMFKALDFNNLFLTLKSIEKHLFGPVLQEAIVNYPQKTILKKWLGDAFFSSEDYSNAVESYRDFHRSVCYNDDEGYLDDAVDVLIHLDVLQNLAISNFKVGNLDTALNVCNKVIKNLPIYTFDDFEAKDIDNYIDTFLTRLDIRIKNDEKDLFLMEYEELINELDSGHHVLGSDYIPEYYQSFYKNI